MQVKNNFERFVLITLALAWAIICLFPIWMVISVTFSTDTSNITQTFFPNSLMNGIVKIKFALNTVNIWKATIDTFLYTFIAIIGMLVTSSLAAYEFAFYNFPFKKILFSTVMISMMLPIILYVIPLYRFVYEIGLTDTYFGIALPIMISPFSVFLLKQFSEDFPKDLLEAAKIDGANHFQIYFHIVLPLMRNGLITATVLLFLKSWGAYLWPSLASGQKISPISVTIANLLNPNFYVDTRVKIASMLLSMLPPLAIYLIFQRYVIRGISMSGIKG